jgi:hypothetical protein
MQYLILLFTQSLHLFSLFLFLFRFLKKAWQKLFSLRHRGVLRFLISAGISSLLYQAGLQNGIKGFKKQVFPPFFRFCNFVTSEMLEH